MSLTISTRRSRAAAARSAPRQSIPIAVITPTPPPPRPRPRRRRNASAQSDVMRTPVIRDYVNTLRDPFEYPSIRMGFGCLTQSDLYTAYFRNPIVSAADGTFAMFILPAMGVSNEQIWYCNSGLNTTTWNHLPFSNRGSLQALGHAARTVSCGLRLIPQVPATAAPGYCYAGSFPAESLTSMLLLSPQALAASPLLAMGMAVGGASAESRPVDPNSFCFQVNKWSGYSGVEVCQNTIPVIVLTNLPASVSILCSGVVNCESIRDATDAAQSVQNPSLRTNSDPTLADTFPSVERMWSYVRNLVPSGETINAGFSVAAAAGSALRTANNVINPRRRLFPTTSSPRITVLN